MTFLLAWVDETDAFVARNDEDVFSFQIEGAEGTALQLTIEMRNPRVGLLGPGRKRWVWASWTDSTSLVNTPIGKFRLIGIPDDIEANLLKLVFIAQPSDYVARKAVVAATKRVLPYFDPVFVSEEDRLNDDFVLEGYPEVYHCDPVTHAVTTSDIVVGDATQALDGNHWPDYLQMSFGSPPVRAIYISGKLQWSQHAAGIVDLTNAFYTAGGTRYGLQTMTGEGLESDWPKTGTGLGSGWTFWRSEPNVVAGKLDPIFDLLSQLQGSPLFSFPQVTPTALVQLAYPVWTFRPIMQMRYDADQSRIETFEYWLECDVQPVKTDPGTEEQLSLSFTSSELDQPIDPGGASPIGDVRRRQYLTTDRGQLSLQYTINVARAKLLSRARCVEIRGRTDFSRGLSFSLRNNLSLTDPDLPGGSAIGKLTSYTLSGNGETGEFYAEFVISSCVGTGLDLTPSTGDPGYVVDGYVDPGYQLIIGRDVVLSSLDVSYADYTGTPPNDDGIDYNNITADQALNYITLYNPVYIQKIAMQSYVIDPGAALENLKSVPTQIELSMKPVTGQTFTTNYAITTSLLMAPLMIDLEAT